MFETRFNYFYMREQNGRKRKGWLACVGMQASMSVCEKDLDLGINI